MSNVHIPNSYRRWLVTIINFTFFAKQNARHIFFSSNSILTKPKFIWHRDHICVVNLMLLISTIALLWWYYGNRHLCLTEIIFNLNNFSKPINLKLKNVTGHRRTRLLRSYTYSTLRIRTELWVVSSLQFTSDRLTYMWMVSNTVTRGQLLNLTSHMLGNKHSRKNMLKKIQQYT